MIIFRAKSFSKLSSVKKGVEYIGKYPTIPVSLATLGISTSNLVTNKQRNKASEKYQEKQLKAMDNLTKALVNVDKTMKTPEQPDETKKIGVKYRIKKQR